MQSIHINNNDMMIYLEMLIKSILIIILFKWGIKKSAIFFFKKKNVLDYVPINKIGGGHPLKNNLKKRVYLGPKES